MAYSREWLETEFPGGKWQASGDYLISSPLREDRNPSFAINPEKRVYLDRATDDKGKISDLLKQLGIPDPYCGKDGRGKVPSPRISEIKKDATPEDARLLWNECAPAESHPYAEKKHIPLEGLRITPGGCLAIPQIDVRTGEMCGIERIAKDGKKFQYSKHGGVHVIGEPCAESKTPILIAEGVATGHALHRLSGWPVVVAFSASMLPACFEAVRSRFPDSPVYTAPDNDDAGLGKANDAAALGAGIVRIPRGEGKGDDWLDLEQRYGPERAREIFSSQWEVRDESVKREPEISPASFALRRIGDIPLTEPEFLVDDLLETDTLALFFGESGCRKTFVAFDVAASIATGAPYAGRQTKEGTVIYLAGEGTGGLPRRAKAWEMHRGISLKDAPLFTLSRAALFMDEQGAKTVEEEVERVASEAGAPLLIVIDTVARSMVGGDENSAKDTGIFIERVDALRRKYGASCLLVHHNGVVDKGRLRGSSAWKGALDAEFHVTLEGDIVTLSCKKMKEAAEPEPISFRSCEYVVMEGKTGKQITSLALERTDERATRGKELSAGLKRALDSYHAAAGENPELDAEGRFLGVHVESWRPFFYETATADTQDGKKKAFSRAIKSLVEGGHLSVRNDIYAPVGGEDASSVNRYAQRMNHSSYIGKRDNGTKAGHVPICPDADDGRDGTDGTHSYRSVPMSRSSVPHGGQKMLEEEKGASPKNKLEPADEVPAEILPLEGRTRVESRRTKNGGRSTVGGTDRSVADSTHIEGSVPSSRGNSEKPGCPARKRTAPKVKERIDLVALMDELFGEKPVSGEDPSPRDEPRSGRDTVTKRSVSPDVTPSEEEVESKYMELLGGDADAEGTDVS